MTKTKKRLWLKRTVGTVVVLAALYGCTQMDYRSQSQILEAGGSIRANVRKPRPQTYENRCKFILDLGNGDVVACFAICKEICQ